MLKKKVLIGDLIIENNIFLAPMAGITDIAFRCLCKEKGAGLTCTEMVSAKGMYYNDKKTQILTKIHETEKPSALQLFGSDPDILAEVAERLNKREDVSIIDINMGCPAPKITKNGEGSALMKDLKLAGKIIEAVARASKKCVTVKIRKGWDDDSINAKELAGIACEKGANAITIHGRTREQYYSGKADWEIIKEIKKEVTIPVIGNGDVFTPEDTKRMLEYTGCDAVMIARGSLGNPWIFSRTLKHIETGEFVPYPTEKEKLDMILRHFNIMEKYKGHHTALKEMRKHIAWYVKGMPRAGALRSLIFKQNNKQAVFNVLREYFSFLQK